MCFQRCFAALAVLAAMTATSWGDIYRWDNGQAIPGTEGITPGPGVQLDHRELEYADLENRTLNNSTFVASNLQNARFTGSRLQQVNFAGANLTNAVLDNARLNSSNLSGANITRANLSRTIQSTGLDSLTPQQFYSTANYVQKNLRGIKLDDNQFDGWSFVEQDLVDASFVESGFSNTDFRKKLPKNRFLRGA